MTQEYQATSFGYPLRLETWGTPTICYYTSVLRSFVITQWLGFFKSPTEKLSSLGNLGEHCLYHTWPIPKLPSTGQLHTFKDPLRGSCWGTPAEAQEFSSNQEANHSTTHVNVRIKLLESHIDREQNAETLLNYKRRPFSYNESLMSLLYLN